MADACSGDTITGKGLVSRVWNELKEAQLTRFPKRPALDSATCFQKRFRMDETPTGPTLTTKKDSLSVMSPSKGTTYILRVQEDSCSKPLSGNKDLLLEYNKP